MPNLNLAEANTIITQSFATEVTLQMWQVGCNSTSVKFTITATYECKKEQDINQGIKGTYGTVYVHDYFRIILRAVLRCLDLMVDGGYFAPI